MRWTTTRLAALVLSAGASAASAQVAPAPAAPPASAPSFPGGPGGGFPGGPGGPGGGGRFQGGPPDADTIWGFMSQGQDSIDVNKRPDMRSRLERSGVVIPTNGIVTKATFKEAFDKRQAERAATRAAGGGGPGGFPGGGPPVMVEAQPQPAFVPPQPEPPQPIPGGPGGKPKKDDEREKPFVSRFGNLPKEAPSFFVELDDDEDGMVGLYEWRRHKRPIPEFVEMDLNGDGLLTPEEYLRFMTAKIAKTPDGKGGKDAAGNRDRRETRAGARPDGRTKDAGPARPTARGQRPDDKAAPADAPKRNPFTDK